MRDKEILDDIQSLEISLGSYLAVMDNWTPPKAREREMSRLRSNHPLIKELLDILK